MRKYLIKWLSLIDRVIRVMIQRLSNNESIYKGKAKKKVSKKDKLNRKSSNNPFQKRHYIKLKTRESAGDSSDR